MIKGADAGHPCIRMVVFSSEKQRIKGSVTLEAFYFCGVGAVNDEDGLVRT